MTDRIRISGEIPRTFDVHYLYGGSDQRWQGLDGSRYEIPVYYESMKDSVNSGHRINSVDHWKVSSSLGELSDFMREGVWITLLGNTKRPSFMLPDDYFGHVVTDGPGEAELSLWSADAFNRFHDQIPTEVSIANFMYELKDIKGLIPKIEKTFSKTASSNFLAYNFGVAPMIGDLKKLSTLSESVGKRLQHLRATAGREITVHYKGKLVHRGFPVLPLINPTFGVNAKYEFRVISYEGSYHASAKIRQNLSGLNDPSAILKAYAASLGLNNPAAIVWEAVPYSFVVDWFFHLDKYVDMLAIQPFGGEYTVSDTCFSLKEETVYEMFQVFNENEGNPKKSLGLISTWHYRRYPGLPMSCALLSSGTLTPKQQLLSLALIDMRR